MNRKSYSDKYNNIHTRWGLPEDKTMRLINEANQQLIDELLDDTPLRISNHFRDRRTDHEYYYDLIDGRLNEDFIRLWFSSRGYPAERTGTDADNKIERTKGKKITTKADITIAGKLIEIQISRQGHRHKYHVKDAKAKKILAGENILMFITGDDYFVVRPDNLDPSDTEYNYFYGGKLCFVVRPNDTDYISLKDKINWI